MDTPRSAKQRKIRKRHYRFMNTLLKGQCRRRIIINYVIDYSIEIGDGV